MSFSVAGGAFSTPVAYASTAIVTLPSADGVYTVVVEVTDAYGNVIDSTQIVRLDRTGPSITASLPAPPAGNAGGYDVGAKLTLTFSAIDSGIGLGTISAKLDGTTTISSGTGNLDVDMLTAGAHTIVITSADALGNTSTFTLTFTIRPTAAGILAAINDGAARGWISASFKTSLVSQINTVIGANNVGPKLRGFISVVQGGTTTQITAAYKTLLLNWANDLLARS